MRRLSLLAIGWLLFVIGCVIAPLPWPFGFGVPMMMLGLYILASHSKWARRALQRLRERYPGASARLDGWKESSIPQVRRFVRITAPQALKRLARIRERRLRLRRPKARHTREPEPS